MDGWDRAQRFRKGPPTAEPETKKDPPMLDIVELEDENANKIREEDRNLIRNQRRRWK